MPTRVENIDNRVSVVKRLLDAYDRSWRRRHNVQPFDEVVSLEIAPYRGQPRTLADGTFVDRGDPLAIIHFNHDGFSSDRNRRRAVLQFRRDFSKTLRRLARTIETDTGLRDVKALYGETWIRPHGSRVGFIAEPLPRTWRTRVQHFYLRLLLRVKFPHLELRDRDTWPHAFWLTRRQLQAVPERLGDSGKE
jgi:hypothetical protein